MARYAIAIDLDRCSGCRACEIACKMENDIPLGEYWSKVVQVGPYGTYPNVHQYFLPRQCQQCENAPCVEVCPTGASYRDEDDIVLIDASTCIGCQLCMTACPYGVRSYSASKNVVEKCTLCRERVADGTSLPACVHTCSNSARYYGDLDDPESDIAKAVAAKPAYHFADSGNGPRLVYLLSEKNGWWIDTDELEAENPEWPNSHWYQA
jgi:Fe-S-cluster-containing dehydrogenase component